MNTSGLSVSKRVVSVGLPLPEIIEHVVEHSGLQAHYRNEKEGADRLENLAELVNAVRVCSLGQITDALFEVGGQYRRSM